MEGKLSLTLIRGAESWQFFAFIFAAIVALAFSLIEDLPVDVGRGWRALTKVGVFVIVGYLTLINSWVRNALVGLLSAFKREAQ